jgi:hypothetical protein
MGVVVAADRRHRAADTSAELQEVSSSPELRDLLPRALVESTMDLQQESVSRASRGS